MAGQENQMLDDGHRVDQRDKFREWRKKYLDLRETMIFGQSAATEEERKREEKLFEERPPFTGDWSFVDWLSDEDLRWADFRGCCLCEQDFTDKDLSGARFDKANLKDAIFVGSNLKGAFFRDANLQGARLHGSKGLNCEHLGGARLQSATLPENLAEFNALENVAEVAKYVQRIFQFLLLLCGYAALTILSTKDEDLIRHHGQSLTSLPMLNASISPIIFAYVVPVLIAIVYTYQFIYVVSLWRLLSFLPAYFPDGTPLDRRAYPTLLNTFVRYHTVNVTNEPYDQIQCLVRGLITFGVPPLILSIFWFSCLRLHNPVLSGSQAVLIGMSLSILVFVFMFCGVILRDEWPLESLSFRNILRRDSSLGAILVSIGFLGAAPFIAELIAVIASVPILFWLNRVISRNLKDQDNKAKWLDKPRFTLSMALLACQGAIIAVLLYSIAVHSFGARNVSLKEISVAPGEKFPPTQQSVFWKKTSITDWIIWAGARPFIDVRSRVVSSRPEKWTGQPKTEGEEMSSVSGADLEGLDLRSTDAERAFLGKANLRRTNLEKAYLRYANLREADLFEANLSFAYLRGASFRDANLQGADLTNAIFSIDLDDPTPMIGANLQGAKLDYRTQFDEKELISSRVNNIALAFFGKTDPDPHGDPKIEGKRQH